MKIMDEVFFASLGATKINHEFWGPSYLLPIQTDTDCSPFHGCLITTVPVDGIQRMLIRPDLNTWVSGYIQPHTP